MSQTRRLAAILAADVVGYSRLMGVDEEGTLERLKALRRELVDPKIVEHHGRIVKTTGDGMLMEFASVVDAVRCAVAVQQAMPERNTGVAADSHIELRIGINLGDVIVEGDDLYGDGVNIAARIEALADAGGVFVSNTVHDQVRDRLPFVFEDLGEQQVKNIARPVRVYRVGLWGVAPTPTPPSPAIPGSSPGRGGLGRGLAGEGNAGSARVRATEPPVLPLPDKPSIAVLPFANMSGDPEQEYFADGMVEEVITALSRIRWLFVIARNSSFAYKKGRAVDVKQVGRELGVRYVLEGSVRKGGNRVRITAQLIDAQSGTHLWADRFDGLLEDVFDLQDQVAISVAGVIEPALQASEISRAAARPTRDLTAYDLYLRALAAMYSYSKDGIQTALRLLDQVIERDSNFAPALGAAANSRIHVDMNGWSEDADENRRAAIDCGRRALAAAGEDPDVLANAAVALAYFGEDIATMIAVVDRALALNPSFARGWFVSGGLRLLAGDPDGAIERVEKSLRLSPRARVGNQLVILGSAYLSKRQFDKAASTYLMAIQQAPASPIPYRFLAACYAHMGRLAEAREMIDRLRALGPLVAPSWGMSRNSEFRELVRSGLRLAMSEAE
jgi:TolB-like protein/class 3 adenylate cyclase